MQTPIQKFRQSFIVFEKAGIQSGKLKTLTSSNYRRVEYFLLGFWTRFLFTNVYKRVFRIYFILFRSRCICKNKKRPGFHTPTETIFINNSRSKQNKKNSAHPFLDIVKQKTCTKFQQKILNSMVVGTFKSFQFFSQIACLIGNNRGLSKFRYQILRYLISITKS